MIRLAKYLKRSIVPILLIVVLLFIQAQCDLALPDYTSSIVNVGIQQSGIDSVVPEQIRASELENILMFAGSQAGDTESALAVPETMKAAAFERAMLFVSADELRKVNELYELNETAGTYQFKGSQAEKEEINPIFARAIAAYSIVDFAAAHPEQVERLMERANTGEQTANANVFTSQFQMDANTDLWELLGKLPRGTRVKLMGDITDALAENGLEAENQETLFSLLSYIWLQNHYETLGVSKDMAEDAQVSKVLSHYTLNDEDNTYHLNTVTIEERQELEDILTLPIFLYSSLKNMQEDPDSASELMDSFGDSTAAFGDFDLSALEDLSEEDRGLIYELLGLDADAGLVEMLAILPTGYISNIKSQIETQLGDLMSTVADGVAVSYLQAEYEAMGIDTGKMQMSYIFNAGAKMLAVAGLAMLCAIFVTFLASRVAASFGRDVRGAIFGKVVSFSGAEFDQFSTASLITRSTNDIQQIQMLLVLIFRMVLYAPIIGVGGVLRVMRTNASMTWIIALAVGLITVTMLILFIAVMPKFTKMQGLVDRLNLVAREILNGTPVIRAFSTEKHEEERFDKANVDFTKVNLFVNRTMAVLFPLVMLLMNIISVLIIWNGAGKVDSGAMQVGDMMAFIQYSMQIIFAFIMIAMVSIFLPRAEVAGRRVAAVLRTEPTVLDPEQAKEFNEDKKGYVEFKDVSFSYHDAEEEVLSGITFTAEPGKTTAIIGSTGSGKSTLINLIPRFFDVTKGQVLLDGVDVRDVTQHSLRDRIGYIPQKGVLFSGTIESNLKYGKPDATDAEMETAAAVAQAMEFITQKKKGFDSSIAQGGTNVSGGQKQRLSIARAIVKRPEVYIFDDSFSALDFKTDKTLRQALKEETGESTVIIVAQRISTIRGAEQIVVLDEGKVAGIGTHDELMQSCETYQQIAYSQLSKEELGNE